MRKIKSFMEDLNGEIVIHKKMLFFEILSALLAGVVLGLLLAPPRSMEIGSNNKNNGNGNRVSHNTYTKQGFAGNNENKLTDNSVSEKRVKR